jgi:hypothetical protein
MTKSPRFAVSVALASRAWHGHVMIMVSNGLLAIINLAPTLFLSPYASGRGSFLRDWSANGDPCGHRGG